MFSSETGEFLYPFPLESVAIKHVESNGLVEAEVVKLPRVGAWRIDATWWRFNGPFVQPCIEPDDRHWRWVSIVRRLRKNPFGRCAALKTRARTALQLLQDKGLI